jgi:hypothetical protein
VQIASSGTTQGFTEPTGWQHDTRRMLEILIVVAYNYYYNEEGGRKKIVKFLCEKTTFYAIGDAVSNIQ